MKWPEIREPGNKGKYETFCSRNYVPIYSRSWWMDAVCGPDNWDVWLYEKGDNILAAMPYYMEKRGEYNYITKSPRTQHNGILFPEEMYRAKLPKRQAYQEEVINAACDYIEQLGVDVYEQQYQPEFDYWLPFYWHGYKDISRVTYTIEDTQDLDAVWGNISSKTRAIIKKGEKNTTLEVIEDPDVFYCEHEKVFTRQGLECPFSYDFWMCHYQACREHDAIRMMVRKAPEGGIASLICLVWDERRIYHILGGSMPGYSHLDSYDALIWDAIRLAHEKGVMYDFEGSVIKRISKSFREFGGVPERYYRIRKVFNPDIIRMEAEEEIEKLVH